MVPVPYFMEDNVRFTHVAVDVVQGKDMLFHIIYLATGRFLALFLMHCVCFFACLRPVFMHIQSLCLHTLHIIVFFFIHWHILGFAFLFLGISQERSLYFCLHSLGEAHVKLLINT